jgi:hypothetical protein
MRADVERCVRVSVSECVCVCVCVRVERDGGAAEFEVPKLL